MRRRGGEEERQAAARQEAERWEAGHHGALVSAAQRQEAEWREARSNDEIAERASARATSFEPDLTIPSSAYQHARTPRWHYLAVVLIAVGVVAIYFGIREDQDDDPATRSGRVLETPTVLPSQG